jgi:hypothetical protein
MNIQGISGSEIAARTFNPGVTLNQIKDSIKNNGLSEVIIKNESGFHVIHGKNLSFESDYFRHSDGAMAVTNISNPRQLPKEGARVSFGDIQGELVTADAMVDPNKTTITGFSTMAGAGIGGILGFGVALGNSRYPSMEEIFGGFMGGALAAGIGAGVGMAVGATITALTEKEAETDERILKSISQPLQ